MLQLLQPVEDGGYDVIVFTDVIVIRAFYKTQIMRPGVSSAEGSRVHDAVVDGNNFIYNSVDTKDVGIGRELCPHQCCVPRCEIVHVAWVYTFADGLAGDREFPVVVAYPVEGGFVPR